MEDAWGWLRNSDLNYVNLDIDEQTDATVQKILSTVPDALERNPIEMAATMEVRLIGHEVMVQARTSALNGECTMLRQSCHC
jgi:hypothetical protein